MKDSLTKAVLRRWYCVLREMLKNRKYKTRASIMISMSMLDLHYSFKIIMYVFLKLSDQWKCPNTLFLTLICFRAADVLATCAPKAPCSTDPRTNYTTRHVCVTAVSRWPMCRAVLLKSVLCQSFDSVLSTSPDNANLFWHSHRKHIRPAYRS